MRNSEMQTQKILNYLYGKMNKQENIKFIQDCKNDSNLNNELNLHKEVDSAIKTEIKVKHFKNQLNTIHNEVFAQKQSKVINLQNKWYWAAASITVFSGTAIYTIARQFQNPDKLFNSYYAVWNPSMTTRSVTSEIELTKIIESFEAKDYGLSLQLINLLSLESQRNPKILLITGCSLMENEKYTEAIEVFDKFDNANYTLYTDAGNWYKALCLLKNKNINKAKSELKNIVKSKGTYSLEAQEVLKKIK
ncbi:MAG: hypothetical protein JEZ09_02940 [Salinivirgaceae bacterium]|nr:hypothetical protein [Salinivirgaceae bacterium]